MTIGPRLARRISRLGEACPIDEVTDSKMPVLRRDYCEQVRSWRTADVPELPSPARDIPWHLRLTSLGGTVLTILICFLIGLRGFRLLITIVVLWFPEQWQRDSLPTVIGHNRFSATYGSGYVKDHEF